MTATLTLYAETGWVSPWVFHVMTALAEKGLPYQLELVPLPIPPETKALLRERAYLGKVPVLGHGDLWLTESLAISEYLAETFPAPGYPRCGAHPGVHTAVFVHDSRVGQALEAATPGRGVAELTSR